MVALNPAYAPRKSIDAAKNRVGDFFCESVDRVGLNRLSAQHPRLENELSFTITASGLPYFINADPIGFAGGLNWFAYVDGDPINFIDPTGLIKMNDFSTEQLIETRKGVKGGQVRQAEIMFFGKEARSKLENDISEGEYAKATPASGSEDPVIDRFEKNVVEAADGIFRSAMIQGLNAINATIGDGDWVRDFWHFQGAAEVVRHQRMIDQIEAELESRGVNLKKLDK